MQYLPDKLIADLRRRQPPGLWDHVERTSEVCRALAERFGYDPAKAKATAIAHDITRDMSDADLLALTQQIGIQPSEVEKEIPILLHGPVGAVILRRDYGLADEEMLGAIACHTTGKRDMGMLDKLLFLADKLDPEKVSLRPELEKVSKLAESDLDGALLAFFDLQLSTLIANRLLIHPAMVEARNQLLSFLEQ